MESKVCTKCGKPKHIADFAIAKSRGRRSECKECLKQYHRDYRSRNLHKVQGQGRKHKLSKYGMTELDYLALQLKQNHRCAICGLLSDKRLYVDHDHSTGKVRGLLCMACNIILGKAKDSTTILTNAIEYLKKHASQAA